MVITDFNTTIQFEVKLIDNHPHQKYCGTPKGFYQQGKFFVFVGDRLTGSSTRIKVPAKEVVEIKIIT